ncbi:MAG TPA: nucleotidyltransferase [bacterium]|nr:nucleotidyltransferase [bacterium]
MKTLEEIKTIIQSHKQELEREYKIKSIGIFGSYVHGRQSENSDIDIVIEFDLTKFGENFKGLTDTYMALAMYLQRLFDKKVDILTSGGVRSIRVKRVAEDIKRSLVYV